MDNQKTEMSFLEHLEVLRWHLIRSALAIVIFASIAALSAVVVVITAQVSLLATGQATTMALFGGICYIVYTVWAITLGRGMISK